MAIVGIWPSYVVVLRGWNLRIYRNPTRASLCRLAWLEVLAHEKEITGELRIFQWEGR